MDVKEGVKVMESTVREEIDVKNITVRMDTMNVRETVNVKDLTVRMNVLDVKDVSNSEITITV